MCLDPVCFLVLLASVDFICALGSVLGAGVGGVYACRVC